MKAFTIHNIWANILNPTCRVQYSLATPGREVVYFDKMYSTKAEADLALNAEALVWVRDALETFVNHKAKIIESGKHTQQLASLTICKNFVATVFEKSLSLQSIAQRFLKGKTYFEGILPNPNNPSYQSSVDNLNELIKFCKQYSK